VSEYPATLGDLADVEARLDQRLSKLEKRQPADAEVTDAKVSELRGRMLDYLTELEETQATLRVVRQRLAELEKLWVVALANPDLIRELAAQALKGRGAG